VSDDRNLIAYGGLEPVVRSAAPVGEHIRPPASKDGTGASPAAKVMPLVGGMVAGSDGGDLRGRRKAQVRALGAHDSDA
jgi:hypothetical protein